MWTRYTIPESSISSISSFHLSIVAIPPTELCRKSSPPTKRSESFNGRHEFVLFFPVRSFPRHRVVEPFIKISTVHSSSFQPTDKTLCARSTHISRSHILAIYVYSIKYLGLIYSCTNLFKYLLIIEIKLWFSMSFI